MIHSQTNLSRPRRKSEISTLKKKKKPIKISPCIAFSLSLSLSHQPYRLQQENRMDSSINVPRWTPNPSPSKSLLKEAETSAGFDDDIEMQSIASGEEDGRSTCTTDKTLFPFSIAHDFAISSAPHVEIHEASSLNSQVTQTLAIEQENFFAFKEVDFVSNRDPGLFLTWKELLVTVPDGKSGRRPILEGLTGYAEPGKMLAIMGPSGCGKSTLLDSLAGNLSISEMTVSSFSFIFYFLLLLLVLLLVLFNSHQKRKAIHSHGSQHIIIKIV